MRIKLNIKFYLFIIFIFSFVLIKAEDNNISIINLENLNTQYDDFAPSVDEHNNYLYYNSSNKNINKFKKIKIKNNLNIIEVIENNHELFETDKPFFASDNFANNSKNTSYITFNDISAIYTGKVQQTFGVTLGLFQTNFERNNWEDGKIIQSLNNSDFHFHPALSPNGNKLVYCVSKIGNTEDTDLKLALKNSNNEWIESDDLSELNSNFSEITPFFAADDTLYFASNGLNGKGGYDIFYTIYENGIWERPRPLEDINTEFNESDYIKLNNNISLFSSDRIGTKGGLDLWAALEKQNMDNVTEPSFIKLGTNVSEINAQKVEKHIFLIKNPDVIFTFNNLIETNHPEVLKLISNNIDYKPNKIEVYITTNTNTNYVFNISHLDNILFSKALTSKDTILSIPINELLLNDTSINSIKLNSEIIPNSIENNYIASKSIDIFYSSSSKMHILEFEKRKYKVAIMPLSRNFKDTQLDILLSQLETSLLTQKKNIIIESSPTFELTDNQRIRDYFSKISKYKISYNKNIFYDLNSYITNPKFNYLIIYIEI